MIDRYRLWYEHERHANAAMLAMIESVPQGSRNDPRFQKAVVLAAHLAACRANWLDFITGSECPIGPWWDPTAELDSLRPLFATVEDRWTRYLASLSDEDLGKTFDFVEGDGNRYRLGVEGQIAQLVGHAFYHRGQIALLVDQLGGETVDTDLIDWLYPQQPGWGLVGPA